MNHCSFLVLGSHHRRQVGFAGTLIQPPKVQFFNQIQPFGFSRMADGTGKFSFAYSTATAAEWGRLRRLHFLTYSPRSVLLLPTPSFHFHFRTAGTISVNPHAPHVRF